MYNEQDERQKRTRRKIQMSQRNRDMHTESVRKLKARQGEKQGGRKIRREQERMIVWERERENIKSKKG